MKIHTTFDIGQRIYLARVHDRVEQEPCPVCGGAGKIKATDELGGTHTVGCPASSYKINRSDDVDACHHGQVNVRMGSAIEIYSDMVGQIKIEIGGLSGNCNMADHDEQTHERCEGVMCYGTGIGSGSVFYLEDRCPTKLFATEGEARTWAEAEVAVRDALRLQEETAPGAESEDGIPGGNEPTQEMVHPAS